MVHAIMHVQQSILYLLYLSSDSTGLILHIQGAQQDNVVRV